MPTAIHLPSALAAQAGGNRRALADGRTVGEVLDALVSQFPALGPRLRDERGELYPFVTVYLNDQDIRLASGFASAVVAGDELLIVPAVAGG
jgi:molybdopterin converting factor small subunit